MEENNGSNSRLMLALLLSAAVLLIWQVFFAPSPEELAERTQKQAVEQGEVSADKQQVKGDAGASDAGADVIKEREKTASKSAATASPVAEVERTVETRLYRLVLTNVGGGLPLSFHILDPQRYEKQENFLSSMDQDVVQQRSLALTLPSLGVDAQTRYRVLSKPGENYRVVYRDESAGFEIEREMVPVSGSFALTQHIRVRNFSGRPIRDKLRLSVSHAKMKDASSGMFTPQAGVSAKCYHHEDELDTLEPDEDGEREQYDDGVEWIAADEPYFATAIIPAKSAVDTCIIKSDEFTVTAALELAIDVPANGEKALSFDIYMGPKEDRFLDVMEDRGLFHVIDYGWLEILAKPMAWILTTFRDWLGNWGLAIILMTIIVRLMLWPIAQKSTESMMRMSQLSPQLNELREKYKGDPAMLQQKQIELYREHDANPLGCLPLLLQMPIFFALYRTIYTMGGLYNAPFYGWIEDLSAADPYFILPILTVALFFAQQMITPSGPKTGQQKIMMYTMPAVFGIMMLFLPAALNLYMVVSTMFSILQSFLIRQKMGNNASKQKAGASVEVTPMTAKEKRAAIRRRAEKRDDTEGE